MRDPLTIQIDSSAVEVGGKITGSIIANNIVPDASLPLSLTTMYRTGDSWNSFVLASGRLTDRDPSPAANMAFEIDIPLTCPISWGRTQVVLQADLEIDPSEPNIRKIDILPDEFWRALWSACSSLGLAHTPTSGSLTTAAAGPLKGKIIQIFSFFPTSPPLSDSLHGLDIVFDRATPLGEILYLSANKPRAWFAGSGPHINRYSQDTIMSPADIGADRLSEMITEAILAD